jgi:hypothetical protein
MQLLDSGIDFVSLEGYQAPIVTEAPEGLFTAGFLGLWILSLPSARSFIHIFISDTLRQFLEEPVLPGCSGINSRKISLLRCMFTIGLESSGHQVSKSIGKLRVTT